MFGNQFYHQSLRRYVIMFGNLFNDIVVQRINKAGQVVQTLDVPVAYGPKQKFLVRLAQDPNLDRDVAIQLPRIGFEITSISYAPERKLSSTQRNVKLNVDNKNRLFEQFVPVPYDIGMNLSIFVKNADDGTQILEQILPFFTPEWTTTVKLIDQMDIKMDIPTVIQGVSYEDVYEGDFDTRRTIIYTCDFVVKGYLYGPVRNSGIIKRAVANIYDTNSSNTVFAAEINTRPGLKSDGTSTTDASLSVPVNQIAANSDFGFVTTIDEEPYSE